MIIRDRDRNQIMVGVNPYKDWPKMYKKMLEYAGLWAADIGTYDGKMLPQMQYALNNIVLEKLICSKRDKLVAKFLLYNMPVCLLGVNDDTYLTTHSMPSGSFLTAMFNSLINRMYTAVWFFRYYNDTPSVAAYNNLVLDYVYGDDKINGIREVNGKTKDLHALSMRETFESFGMSFTDSYKKDVKNKFSPLNEISFLKRTFTFHRQLNQITCPLDVNTIYSSISFVDKNKNLLDVMSDKINVFQREMFLHEDKYQNSVDKLELACVDKGLVFVRLCKDYLIKLYLSDLDQYFSHLNVTL